MRVFWPRNCLAGIQYGENCLIIGWQFDDITVAVTALPLLELDLVTKLLDSDSLILPGSASQFYEPFRNRRLKVLTTVNHFSAGMNVKYAKNALEISDCQPCVVIEFDPPNPSKMQYFKYTKTTLFLVEPLPTCLVDEIDFHLPHVSHDASQWHQIVAQINCVYDLQRQLKSKASACFSDLRREPELINVYANRQTRRLSLSASSIRLRSKGYIISLVMNLRNAAEVGLLLLETKPFSIGNVRNLLCICRQLDLRLNQVCDLPLQYLTIIKRDRRSWHWMTPERNESYIRFYNSLLLSANNWILGVYVFTILQNNYFLISSKAPLAVEIMSDWFIVATRWLMKWPAGFKLNTQLAQFIGDIIIWILQAWQWGVSRLLTQNTWGLLVSALAYTGICGGVTLQIGLVIDLLSVLTFPLYLLYQSLARVYNQQLNVLGALFRVFRGKKYNTLRKRVDSGDYDMHQLLMGTILFTVVIFLLPTVLAFYGLFALTRLILLTLTSFLCSALAFCNYFPLFPLLLRIKSPARLPSGIYFQDNKNSLRLLNRPMQVSEIFEQLTTTISRFLTATYNINLLWEFISGQVVQTQQSKLYQPLYSVLCDQRKSVEKLRAELNEFYDYAI